MISIRVEQLIRLEDVRDYIPSSRRGKRLSKAVVFRWASQGVKGVVLETVRVGGARLTSVDAIQRFIDAQNQQSSSGPSPSPSRNRDKAADELSKRGI